MQERILHADTQVQNMKQQNYQLQDKLNKLQSEYHTKEFRVTKLEQEMEIMNQKQSYASYQLREMENLNH